MELYDFYGPVDGSNLIPLIQLMFPKGAVGAEIGVFKAHTFCALLQNCPNITTLYGVDSYQPYTDYLKEPYDRTPSYFIDKKQIEVIKFLAYHNIEYSGVKDKAVIYEEDTSIAKTRFEDESLDFIFLDTYMTREQADQDLIDWYPKVKKGGIFAGHDWTVSAIQDAVYNFREKNSIVSTMNTYNNTWIWIKE